MLSCWLIFCLDVCDGCVVKGVCFCDYVDMGDIVELVLCYCDQGVDELVFYDIGVSLEGCVVDVGWIECIVCLIDILFCVVGGISDVEIVCCVLYVGVDKILINLLVFGCLVLIEELVDVFGVQCVVVGIDLVCEFDG